ncbi:MAG: carboxypeptidase-like regulatory domain-containing protein, partial [Pseudomonadota bacterium]
MTRVLIVFFTLLLAACGGDSGSGDNNQPLPDPVDTFTPEVSNLSSIALVDAGGKPLANASVEISPQAAAASSAPAALLLDSTQLVTTDANGNLVLPDLQPGKYTLSVTIAGITVNTILEILPQNAAGSATVAAPLVVSENASGEITAESLEGKGIFASVSGVIFGPQGVLADAQIELSGGQATNGAVASAITDENGEFTLIINV